MDGKRKKSNFKHIDFIILDIICLQASFVLSYWILHAGGNPYIIDSFRYQAGLLLLSQLIVILFTNGYSGILRRKKYDELLQILKYILEIHLITIFYLFLVHKTGIISRLQQGITVVIFVFIDFIVRTLNKNRVKKASQSEKNIRSIVLVTSSDLVETAMKKLDTSDTFKDFTITKIVLLDDVNNDVQIDIPVVKLSKEAIQEISHEWVDEVFILQPDNSVFPKELFRDFVDMGITVNYTLSILNDPQWTANDIRKLGNYKVLANSTRFVSPGQVFLKRVMDIAGGIVGCIFTGILYLFIAPVIYKQSPGPIFFTQDRVGKNGKIFKMYKFRSMYMDAEERKAELMKYNQMNGLMFKMDDDPRIIGSEKKDKNGKPKGIGNFIRNTSLDEFPQFFNVLKGDMSLVGTRPPTLDEWKQYELHHRFRMSIRPGITGLWQISGRNDITDFEEVVRLDREYIETWDIFLDIKILLKTVFAVLNRKGSK